MILVGPTGGTSFQDIKDMFTRIIVGTGAVLAFGALAVPFELPSPYAMAMIVKFLKMV
jgi:hypothetical protein